jgi:hypothetical protein
MNAITAPFNDSRFSPGIILIVLSLFFFCVPLFTNSGGDAYMGFFFSIFCLQSGIFSRVA